MSNTPSKKDVDDLVYALRQKGDDSTYALVIAAIAKWGTPQPVVRGPLTANQVSGLAESAGYWHGDMSRADFINGIRYAEAAHGIGETP